MTAIVIIVDIYLLDRPAPRLLNTEKSIHGV